MFLLNIIQWAVVIFPEGRQVLKRDQKILLNADSGF